MVWRLGTFDRFALGFGDRQHRVVDAVSRQRPAVVLAGFGNVDFITTARAVLVSPEAAAPGVERRTLLVAMSVGPDFFTRAIAGNERIVLGNAPVRENARQLALQLVQLLAVGRSLLSPRAMNR